MPTDTDTRYPAADLAKLHADAYTLRHVDNLTWDQVAAALDEPVAVVKDWAQTYIDRTDAAAAEQQMSLFD
ncbi:MULTISPECIES: hypothetical protein [unclassified Gordonia (in: high G+C Gram-positive bacteria)]|uniref:hypothetical protein n=1 Tax=unclassified Gordonia (in: high G+C Gram-positive bacteria) TaxID=2657482 RepID=UPI00080E5197|nr:hypothetical protein [Gordonia sp. UCD-TK1]OCH82883.1 hypothetical protein A9310_11335 [Gordonia sp. UCD-TK1]